MRIGWARARLSAPTIPLLRTLMNAIGADLKGRVLCLSDLENVWRWDTLISGSMASRASCRAASPRKGQMPERGVVEMKPVADDAWLKARSNQVTRYFEAYRL